MTRKKSSSVSFGSSILLVVFLFAVIFLVAFFLQKQTRLFSKASLGENTENVQVIFDESFKNLTCALGTDIPGWVVKNADGTTLNNRKVDVLLYSAIPTPGSTCATGESSFPTTHIDTEGSHATYRGVSRVIQQAGYTYPTGTYNLSFYANHRPSYADVFTFYIGDINGNVILPIGQISYSKTGTRPTCRTPETYQNCLQTFVFTVTEPIPEGHFVMQNVNDIGEGDNAGTHVDDIAMRLVAVPTLTPTPTIDPQTLFQGKVKYYASRFVRYPSYIGPSGLNCGNVNDERFPMPNIYVSCVDANKQDMKVTWYCDKNMPVFYTMTGMQSQNSYACTLSGIPTTENYTVSWSYFSPTAQTGNGLSSQFIYNSGYPSFEYVVRKI